MVVPHRDKQKQNKLTTDTSSISETAVTARSHKTKLPAHQEKLRRSKPDKLQPLCLADSVQSLWSATREQQSCAARMRLSFLDTYVPESWFSPFPLKKKKKLKKNLPSLASRSSPAFNFSGSNSLAPCLLISYSASPTV